MCQITDIIDRPIYSSKTQQQKRQANPAVIFHTPAPPLPSVTSEGNSNSPAGNRNVVDDFDNGGFLADLSSGGGNRNNFSGDEDDDDFLHDDFDM